jgi:hypothetical protein
MKYLYLYPIYYYKWSNLRKIASGINVIQMRDFEVTTAVKIRDEVFWVVTPYSVVVEYQCFGGPCCLPLHTTMTRETARYSETLISFHNTVRRHNPEDLNLNIIQTLQRKKLAHTGIS